MLDIPILAVGLGTSSCAVNNPRVITLGIEGDATGDAPQPAWYAGVESWWLLGAREYHVRMRLLIVFMSSAGDASLNL